MSFTWQDLLAEEQQQAYFLAMLQEIEQRRQQGVIIYPPRDEVFNAFNATPLDKVKVVILGQDPYHGPNQAHGLCFSVLPGVPHPPSLRNMFKELQQEYPDYQIPAHGCLQAWAEQGVLLLNTVLTVEQGKAHSHSKLGWERFTDSVISLLSAHTNDLIFVLWGSHAQKKGQKIDSSRHHILAGPHPSPLSAHRGFFGCDHFRAANRLLEQMGKTPINWQLPPAC